MAIQKIKGTKDIFGNEMKKWQKVEEILHYVSALYQFEEFRTPELENTEVFKRENDSSDVVNKEMYTFTDQGGRSLSLRPEVTASIVRSFVENKLYAAMDMPAKFYYLASNFRSERPQKGRYRIFHQYGVELLGAKNPYVDAEVIAMAYTILAVLGLEKYELQINTLGDAESRERYTKALVEHFNPVKDELCADCQRRLVQNPLRVLDCKVDVDHPSFKTVPSLQDYLSTESLDYFEEVKSALDGLGINYVVNDKMVRGLDYYTGIVFEAVPVDNPMINNTLLAGGRYDNLVSDFDGPEVNAIGFAAGIERLILAIEGEEIPFEIENQLDVYFMPLDAKYQKEALSLATICRASGLLTDVDYLGRSMKSQFKTVEKRNASVVAMLGEDEVLSSQITLKHTKTQKQITVPMVEIVKGIEELLHDEHHHTHHHHDHDHDCDCGHDHDHDHECSCGHNH